MLRITGGCLAGRRFSAPRRGVRPTADRVREALFALLGSLEGARVLDLCAGSGALGLEALSRGAAEAVFVERSAQTAATLRRNIEQLGMAPRSRVLRADLQSALARLGGGGGGARFDLVLLDPPYQADLVRPALRGPALGRLAAPGAVLVVETGRLRPPEAAPGFRLSQQRRYGDTLLTIYRAEGYRAGQAPNPAARGKLHHG